MNTASQTATLAHHLKAMEKGKSLLQEELRKQPLPACEAFGSSDSAQQLCLFEPTGQTLSPSHGADLIASAFPQVTEACQNQVLKAVPGKSNVTGKQVGVLFSGGPAAGGHNVIVGIKKALGPNNTLWGIQAGPKGLMEGKLFQITDAHIAEITNSGGFDFLGSDRTKIKTDEQFQKVRECVQKYNLDGIIVVGGDDSNTNAAFLAEMLFDLNCSVIGVPKTIDGDLQIGELLPISFGFDTATKIYAEMVGNILQDAPSSRKYWHFVKLMGRSASHVALEVALQTHPHIALISEEVAEKKMTLKEIVQKIASVIAYRASKGWNYGVVLIPEGLIEFVPELRALIDEINVAMAEIGEKLDKMGVSQRILSVQDQISPHATELFNTLPDSIQHRLMLDRDSHGNLKVSQIPTEELLLEMTAKKIAEMQHQPDAYFLKEDLDEEANSEFGQALLDMDQATFKRFTSFKFETNNHFFGYEGRCGAPTRFDAAYTFNLGLVAGSLILSGKTGYMASITSFEKGASALAIPLSGLITTEIREGKQSKVIEKALVKLDSPAFAYFAERRNEWAKQDLFSSPGPIQFWGPTSDQIPFTVALNQGYSKASYQFKSPA